MKKLLVLIISIMLTIPAWADSKLSALSNNGSISKSDLTYDVASGTSYNVNWDQVFTLMAASSNTWSSVQNHTANVGIGSANPTQKLDVLGTVKASGVTVTTLTASQITATDASKNLQSLDTATYPSLTELSYGKGVTSAIQTQINSKQANLSLVAGSYTDGKVCTYTSAGTVLNCNTTMSGGGGGGSNLGSAGQAAYYASSSTTVSGISTVFFSGSNVGVGSTNPGQLLDVQGTVRSLDLFTQYGNIKTQVPAAPVVLGSLFDTTFDGAGWLKVRGKYVYMTARNSGTFNIIDVSDPTNPVRIGQYNNSIITGAEGLEIVGNYAYITCYAGNAFVILDISNPSNPTLKGSIVDGTNLNGAEDVVIKGNIAFISNAVGNGITSVDITDPSNPKIIQGNYLSGHTLGPEYVLLVGKYLYVTNTGINNFNIIDISNPANMTEVGNVSLSGVSVGEVIQGKYAYVADLTNKNIDIINISNPASPSLSVTFSTGTLEPWVIAPSGGKYIYVSGIHTNSIMEIDISNPTSPIILNNIVDATNLNGVDDIKIDGNYIYGSINFGKRFTILDAKGFYIPQLTTTSFHAENASISNDFHADGIIAHTGLNVGSGGVLSNGKVESSTGMISMGNIGIGTLYPGKQLDVQGTVRTTNLVVSGINGSTQCLHTDTNGVVTGTGSDCGSGTGGLWNTTNTNDVYEKNGSTFGNVAIGTSNTATSALTIMNGNVGIGTWIPAAFLEVKGTLSQSSFGGNVGIGLTSPGQALDVTGTVRAIGLISTLATASTPAIFDSNKQLASGSYSGNTTVITTTTGSHPTNDCAKWDASGNIIDAGATCGSGGGGGSGTVNSGTTGQIAYYASSSTVVSGNSDILLVGNNVGIGSTAPGQILDIQGTVRTVGLVSTLITASKPVVTNAGQQLTAATNLQDLAYCQTGGTNCPGSITGFGNPSASISTVTVNGSAVTAMRSDAAPMINQNMVPFWGSLHTFASMPTSAIFLGNVGIGTATASAALQVGGSGNSFFLGNVGIGTNFASSPLVVVGSGNSWVGSGNFGIDSINPGTNLDVQGTARISNSLSIGSSLPTVELDVQGTVRFTKQLLNTTSTTGIGWTVQTGANTACNTTCSGHGACVFGFDTGLGGSDVVNCASALADTCVCAGP